MLTFSVGLPTSDVPIVNVLPDGAMLSGVKVTVNVQLVCARTTPPQSSVSENIVLPPVLT